jgi:hypothetical protein
MTNIVPFGKYRGQPVEALAADRDYCDWLMGQAWFHERYGNVYTLIANNFAEPSETPEHNALQARFLDQDFCRRLLRALPWEPIASPLEFADPAIPRQPPSSSSTSSVAAALASNKSAPSSPHPASPCLQSAKSNKCPSRPMCPPPNPLTDSRLGHLGHLDYLKWGYTYERRCHIKNIFFPVGENQKTPPKCPGVPVSYKPHGKVYSAGHFAPKLGVPFPLSWSIESAL